VHASLLQNRVFGRKTRRDWNRPGLDDRDDHKPKQLGPRGQLSGELTAIRGTRLGVLWGPSTLLYGTFGVAYGQVKEDAIVSRGAQSASLTFQDWKAGWTAGGGIETAVGNGWSAKLEYLYMDLGKTESTIATPGLGTLAATSRRFTDNIVRIGFNYKWGGGGYGGGSGY
jgi:opacity protein-like surface antigen